MSQTAAPTDRRHVRRAQTIEQIVDVALEVMAEQGVAGLSLGEVARRIGIRPPSLYVYFDSKNDLYDAVFARGWREIDEVMAALGEPAETADPADLAAFALRIAETFVRWHVEHPVYAHLMAWRPVPGYEPSPQAYAPSVATFARSTRLVQQLQALGLLRPDVEPQELLRVWTVLISGVMTQQLANAPQQPFETGTFTTMLPQLVEMFLAHYAPSDHPSRQGRA